MESGTESQILALILTSETFPLGRWHNTFAILRPLIVSVFGECGKKVWRHEVIFGTDIYDSIKVEKPSIDP